MPHARYKHLFFDLDGTLTRSRTLVTPQMKQALESLPQTIIVVSGQPSAAIKKQLEGAHVDFELGQNGNHAFHGNEEIWQNRLSDEERSEILDHIGYIENVRDWEVNDPDDLIEDRVSQISYSFIGHHEDVGKKEAFDPGGSFRQKILDDNPRPLRLTDAKIAGTTCIDYFKKGSNKGVNVQRLIDREGWKNEDCVYFGDAIFKGGNDEAVMGVIDVQHVDDEHHTLRLLKEHYNAA